MERTSRRRKLQHWLLLLLRAATAGPPGLRRRRTPLQGGAGLAGRAAIRRRGHPGQQLLHEGPQREFHPLRPGQERGDEPAGGRRPAFQRRPAGHQRPAAGRRPDQQHRNHPPGSEQGRDQLRPRTIAQRVRQAIALLEAEKSQPQKSIYLFSDLQRSSFDELLQLDSLAAAKDIHLFVVNAATGPSTTWASAPWTSRASGWWTSRWSSRPRW